MASSIVEYRWSSVRLLILMVVVSMSLVIIIVVGLDHCVALALRYDVCVGREILRFVVVGV